MYSDKDPKKSLWRWLAPLLAVVILAAALHFAHAGRDIDEESAQAIRDAVQSSALQCYAVEGVYPPDLAYLTENYGLTVNTEDFYITYEAYASNLPPEVIVQPKAQKGGGR